MKKLLFLLLLSVSLPALSGGIGPNMRSALRALRFGLAPKNYGDTPLSARRLTRGHTSTLLPVSITLAEGYTTADLQEAGLEVQFGFGRYALTTVAPQDVDAIAALPCVRTIELQKSYVPKLDRARAAVGIDKIHAGENLPQAYTGRGVVAGIVDTGMDPNHINFRHEDGTSRIGYFASIKINPNYQGTGNPLNIREYDSTTVATFKTENAQQYHGTHTMGILAGGFRGYIDMAEEEDGVAGLTNGPNPYYGAATDATIAAATGELQDAVIATGVDNIINYAYNEHKPCVLSLSLGSNDGPHDGTEVMNQFLDLATKEAIVCISAGNEGDLPVALHKEFTDEDTLLQTFLMPMVYGADDPTYPNLRYGTVKIYSRDSSQLQVQAVVYNKKRGRIAYRMPIEGNTDGNATYYCSADSFKQETTDVVSPLLDKAVCGYVGVGSMIDDGSGRYEAMIDLYAYDNRKQDPDQNYLLGITVVGRKGQRVDLFSDAQFMAFDDYDQAGWTAGTTDGSISSMACGKNVIVVGAYNTKNHWGAMDGYAYQLQDVFPEGDITNFSSYGTLVDGRHLPTVCAPGTAIVSSCNYYYYNAYGEPASMVQAVHDDGERKSPYTQTMGTSMSTPLVAGAIALWLEADPTLTCAEVRDIIEQTAVKDDHVLAGDSVQWGAGKFDAYAGLKEVLRRKGGAGLSAAALKPLIRSLGARRYEVVGAPRIDVYTPAGLRVLSTTSAQLDASSLPRGIYIVKAGAQAVKINL